MWPTCAGGLTSVFVVSQGVQNGDDVPHYLVVLSHLQTARCTTLTHTSQLVALYPRMLKMGIGGHVYIR